MKARIEEKERAISLRRKGLSIGRISKMLNISKGSISPWVRDIELTQKQKEKLNYNITYNKNRFIESNKIQSESFRKKREIHRGHGRELAKKKEFLHMQGCMLYWAEGYKRNNRSKVCFVNSDVDMMKLFVNFLKIFYDVRLEDIKISIACYTDFCNQQEIEEYWMSELGLTRNNLNKTTVNVRPISSKEKRIKERYKYGTCSLSVCDVKILQSIFGAIQEYGGFEKPEWCV